MPFSERCRRQVALLVRLLPFVAEENCLALKGGTAINLFIRDLPRLSVDIDLTYLPVRPRQDSLTAIDSAMRRIAETAGSKSAAEKIVQGTLHREGTVTKLVAHNNGVQVKIEVNPVLRGCVFNPETRAVSSPVEMQFDFAEMQLLSFADIYGGKIVAALDRQQPRDLFDVRNLLANEGIGDDLRRAFIVYLLSHNRPMHEVIAPTLKDIDDEYEHGFAGMTEVPVRLDELLSVRLRLIREIVGNMPDEHRRFLISFERGEPAWSILGLDHVKNLPAIRWRQRNLDKLDNGIRRQLVERLKRTLST